MSIAENVKSRRKALSLTVRDLAELTGMTSASISRIENGAQGVSVDSLQALAKALKCTVQALLADRDHPEADVVVAPLIRFDAGGWQLEWAVDAQALPSAFVPAGSKPAVFVVPDQAMSPHINKGDCLVVDMHATSLTDNALIIGSFGRDAFVRRVHRSPRGGVRLSTDNPDKARHPDWDLTDEDLKQLSVAGRVFFAMLAI